MHSLARLPVFYALNGKRAVVAGGTAPAAWKAELLSAAGAAVDVFAAELGEEMTAASAEAPGGPIALHARDWTDTDLEGAVIAIGAFDDDADAERFVIAARAHGVPVNVVDKPAYCDFAFGSIVNRSPLVVGISTDGAAPVFAQAIRAKLEALIPNGFAHWAQAAQRWRGAVQASGLGFSDRRRFWQRFTARALADPERIPDDAQLKAMLVQIGSERGHAEIGSVVIVGAGPGDPELLTLRAARALQSADVIVIDDRVPAEILDFARREARKVRVAEPQPPHPDRLPRQRGRGNADAGEEGYVPRGGPADDTAALMVSLAREGKRVVRLMAGDPVSSGRAGEERTACEEAGIAVEVVPGITS